MKVSDIDKNMKLDIAVDRTLEWRNALGGDFTVYGFPLENRASSFNRLGDAAAEIAAINDGAAYFAGHTAGGQLHFMTDSDTIQIQVLLQEKSNMCHMPATGQSGVDCYRYDEVGERFQFTSCATFDIEKAEYAFTLYDGEGGTMRRFILNLPLYSGVRELSVGVRRGSRVMKTQFTDDGRIIVYGTSIVQGGCASRPGMAHTNILSRALGIEVVNMGFSGVAFVEPEIGDVLGRIERQKMLIVDAEPNAGMDGRLQVNLPKFIASYRNRQKNIPVLLVSRTPFAMDTYDDARVSIKDFYRQYLRRFVRHSASKGDRELYFADGYRFFRGDIFEYTVDGVHPTDLGFKAIADGYERAIRKILKI